MTHDPNQAPAPQPDPSQSHGQPSPPPQGYGSQEGQHPPPSGQGYAYPQQGAQEYPQGGQYPPIGQGYDPQSGQQYPQQPGQYGGYPSYPAQAYPDPSYGQQPYGQQPYSQYPYQSMPGDGTSPPKKGIPGFVIALIIIGVVLVLGIAGTTTFLLTRDGDDKASSETGEKEDEEEEPELKPQKEDAELVGSSTTFEFGETAEWEDGVKVTLETPEEYDATEGRVRTPGYVAYRYEVTVENGSDAILTPFPLFRAQSGDRGTRYDSIFDSRNDVTSVTNTIAPGSTSETYLAFEAPPDIEDVTVEVILVTAGEREHALYRGNL